MDERSSSAKPCIDCGRPTSRGVVGPDGRNSVPKCALCQGRDPWEYLERLVSTQLDQVSLLPELERPEAVKRIDSWLLSASMALVDFDVLSDPRRAHDLVGRLRDRLSATGYIAFETKSISGRLTATAEPEPEHPK